MGESNGIIFGNNKEEWCGGNLRSNHYSPPEFMNLQKEWCKSSPQLSPLGLKLKKSKSFLDLLHDMYGKKQEELTNHQNSNRNKPKIDQTSDLGYRKASNFQAALITIGSWKKLSRRAGDLTAKIYYAKRKLVWEVLEGGLKSKMEVEWSQITAIRASMPDDSYGILEIELSIPPSFYRESSPQPKKHTLWHQISDFTGGHQASNCRRHLVIFPPGIFEKHYENLLRYSPSLYALSLKPFPSSRSPFFDPPTHENSGFSLDCSGYESQCHPHGNHPATTEEVFITSNQSSTVSDTYQLYLPVTHNPTSWNQGPEIYVVNGIIQGQSDMNLVAQGNEAFTSQNHHSNTRELINIDNSLLWDPQNYHLEPSLHTSYSLLDANFNNSNWMDTEMKYQINDNDHIMQNAHGNGAISGNVRLNNMIECVPQQDSNQKNMVATMENYYRLNPFSSANGDFLDSAF
ncbi:uncharacterized protein LOC142528076 [Primulina tabacum]|uniref:uncharacterized protein LOC142528076 n=1 Tax=Primulina tabacum TaxID=48773 RepID=UPI003F59754E